MKKTILIFLLILVVSLASCSGEKNKLTLEELVNLGWSCEDNICRYTTFESPLNKENLERDKIATSELRYTSINIDSGKIVIYASETTEFKSGYVITLYNGSAEIEYTLEEDVTVEVKEHLVYSIYDEDIAQFYAKYINSDFEWMPIVYGEGYKPEVKYRGLAIEEFIDCEEDDIFMIGDETICQYVEKYISAETVDIPMPIFLK